MAIVTTDTAQQLRAAARVAATYVGTVVGAGFASGQEVLQFFALYGMGAVWGILLAGALLGLFGYLILQVGNEARARSHRDVLDALGSPGLATALDGLITLFLFGGLAAMAAGAGAVAREQLGLPAALGSTLLVAGAAGTVLFGIEGVVRAISAVVPFLVGAVLLVCLGSLGSRPLLLSWAAPGRAFFPVWPLAALAYASYNLVLSLSILGPLGRVSPSRSLLPGAAMGALVLGVAAAAIHLTLFTLGPGLLEETEVPMLAAARRLAPALGTVYALVLLAEVYTTAVGNLFGVVARLRSPGRTRERGHRAEPRPPKASGRGWTLATLGTALIAWAVAQLGFSTLVRNLYSVMGIAGTVLLVTLIRRLLGRNGRAAS
ncbi:YkvI family membrane protein [Limnochorda pilosa]|uniref:Membrane protein n=1 Tax=Limnochorda pilosa TaxID=1555112 RepID=A0A0K2SPW0_LIMPI|nr:hypothetical protein [Limnochorda pilosa]BAS29148.1 membrane protein [Limnochorda pilosa]